METASERRKRKLEALCETHGRLAIATKAKVNPVSLEQILKGVLLPKKADGTRSARSLGDKAARAIEAAYGLGEGWFDAPDDSPNLPDDALAIALSYAKMTPAEKQRLRLLMLAARDGIQPPIAAAPKPGGPPDLLGGDSWFDKLDTPEATPAAKKKASK